MKKRIALIGFLILSTVGCDQVTKIVAQSSLQYAGALSYLGDTFRLEYAENKGAFLSFGAKLPEAARTAIFMVLVSIFLGVVGYQLITKNLDRATTIAYSLILGGGIGNLIDRFLRGSVIDFLNVGVGSLRTGIFNVADMAVVAGLIILFLKPKDKLERNA
jgi:signal peptidase II